MTPVRPQQSSSLTHAIARHIASTHQRVLPDEVVERAKHHLLDTISAIVSGAELKAGKLGRAYVEALGGTDEAAVLGCALRSNAVNAAFSNGMSAHADETDDSHPASITHPGCAVVPAALAMAEAERADGPALLRAIVLGYDLCARMALSLGAGRYLTERGFDTHAFGGVFGAASAAAALARLDPPKVEFALSYAAQQCAGLATLFRDRHHVEKAFVFAGMPARNGVSSVTMVRAGLTGVSDVLDGETSFFSAFEPMNDPATIFADLGSRYAITETDIKRWSVGSPIQAALDSLEALLPGQMFRPEEVSSIKVQLPAEGARIVNGRNMPSVNAQHLVALRLVDGALGFVSSHDESRMNEPDVLAMRGKVTLEGSDELSKSEPSRQAIVEIDFADGTNARHHTRYVRGTHFSPMTREELTSKVLDLMGPLLGLRQAACVCDMVWTLDREPSLERLIDALTTTTYRSSAAL